MQRQVTLLAQFITCDVFQSMIHVPPKGILRFNKKKALSSWPGGTRRRVGNAVFEGNFKASVFFVVPVYYSSQDGSTCTSAVTTSIAYPAMRSLTLRIQQCSPALRIQQCATSIAYPAMRYQHCISSNALTVNFSADLVEPTETM